MFHVSNVTVTLTAFFFKGWRRSKYQHNGQTKERVKSNEYLYSILGHNLALFFGIYQANHTILDFTVGFVV